MIPFQSFSCFHSCLLRENTTWWVVLKIQHAEESSGTSVPRVSLSLIHPQPSPSPATRKSDTAGWSLEIYILNTTPPSPVDSEKYWLKSEFSLSILVVFNSGTHLISVISFKKKKKFSMPAHSPPRPQSNQIGMPSAWDPGISVLSRLPGNWMFGVSRWYYLSGLLDIRFQGPPWRFWFTRSVWGTALESTSHTGAPGDSYNGIWEMCLSCLGESQTPLPSKAGPIGLLTSVLEPHSIQSTPI